MIQIGLYEYIPALYGLSFRKVFWNVMKFRDEADGFIESDIFFSPHVK